MKRYITILLLGLCSLVNAQTDLPFHGSLLVYQITPTGGNYRLQALFGDPMGIFNGQEVAVGDMVYMYCQAIPYEYEIVSIAQDGFIWDIIVSSTTQPCTPTGAEAIVSAVEYRGLTNTQVGDETRPSGGTGICPLIPAEGIAPQGNNNTLRQQVFAHFVVNCLGGSGGGTVTCEDLDCLDGIRDSLTNIYNGSIEQGDFYVSNDTLYHINSLNGQVQFVVLGNGDCADCSATNEIQNITINGNVITLSDGGFISLPANLDNDPLNEIQTLSVSGDTLFLSNGGFAIFPSLQCVDCDATNEIQTISQNGDTIFISGGGFVVLPSGTIDTDQQVISISGNDITLSAGTGGGGTITLLDNDPNNEIQTITQVGDLITLSNGGGSFTLPSFICNDCDPANELQVISLIGDTIFLSDGGFIVLPSGTIDTDQQTLSLVGNNLILSAGVTGGGGIVDLSNLTGCEDCDATNEIQTLSVSGDTIFLSQSNFIILPLGTVNTDQQTLIQNGSTAILSAGVTGGGGTFTEVDGSITNELQTLSIIGDTLFLTNGGFVLLPSMTCIDCDPTNELQELSLVGDTIFLSNGNFIVLPIGTVDTDQQTLTINGNVITLSAGVSGGGGSITLLDNDPLNELQSLSLSNDTLFLTNGGFVILPSLTCIDCDPNNEIQTLTQIDDTTFSLSNNGGTIIINPSFTENITNELQTLTQIDDSTFSLSNNGGTIVINHPPENTTNELQSISLNGDTIFLSNGGFVVLPTGTIDTDQQTISLTGSQLTLSSGVSGGGGTVDLSGVFTCADCDVTNELQSLSIVGDTIFLTDGGFIVLPSGVMDTDQQTLSISGNVITLSSGLTGGGGSVTLPNTSCEDCDVTNEIQFADQTTITGTGIGADSFSVADYTCIEYECLNFDFNRFSYLNIDSIKVNGALVSFKNLDEGLVDLACGNLDLENAPVGSQGTAHNRICNGNGVLEFCLTIDTTRVMEIGLSYDNNLPLNSFAIDYAFRTSSPLNIWERRNLYTIDQSTPNIYLSNYHGSKAWFKIDVNKGVVKYYFDDNLIYTSDEIVLSQTWQVPYDSLLINKYTPVPAPFQTLKFNGDTLSISDGNFVLLDNNTGSGIDTFIVSGQIPATDTSILFVNYYITNGDTIAIDTTLDFVWCSVDTISNNQPLDADPDPTNELQDLFLNGNTLTLSLGNSVVFPTDPDQDPNNELQNLSQSGNTITLSNGGGSFNLPTFSCADCSTTNELQQLSYNPNTDIISINGSTGNSIDITEVNTDNQTLSINGNVISLTNGGSVTVNHPINLDNDPINEFQTIAQSGNLITLSNGGGSFTLPSFTCADCSTTNELQTLSQSGNTVTLSNGGGSATFIDTNTQLTQEQVQDFIGGMVSGNTENGISVTYDDAANEFDFVVSYPSCADCSTTNELQNLSQSGNTITLSNGGGSFNLPTFSCNDCSATNEIQTLAYVASTDQIVLSNGGGIIDITEVDTDDQTLSISGNTLTIANGNSVTLPTFSCNDCSATNEIQTLSYVPSTDQIILSSGGIIDITEVNTVLTQEQVQDFIGGMVSGNTESGITVTYDDAANEFDFVVSPTSCADCSTTNEIQTLTYVPSTDQIILSSGGIIDITEVNTDNQTLSISGNTLSIGNGNSVTLPTSTCADCSTTNELQNLFGRVMGDNNVQQFADNTNDILQIDGGTGITTNSSNADRIIINNTAPDQIVSITGGANTTVTGTYPNFTISSTGSSCADCSTTNELQSLSASAVNTFSDIANVNISSGNSVNIYELVQDVVGDMLSGNTESGISVVYDDNSNEIDFFTSVPSCADCSTTNELQSLSYNTFSDVISLSNGNSIDITEVNTDNQTLGIVGNVLTIANGNSVTLPASTCADCSTTNELQNLWRSVSLTTHSSNPSLNSAGLDIADSTTDNLSFADVTGGGVEIYRNNSVDDELVFLHANTSNEPSSNNSGQVFIQDIFLDQFGHVTDIQVATASGGGSDTHMMNTNLSTSSTRTHSTTGAWWAIQHNEASGSAQFFIDGSGTSLFRNTTSNSGISLNRSSLGTRIYYGSDALFEINESGVYNIYRFNNLPNFTNTASADSALPAGAVYNSGGYMRIAN